MTDGETTATIATAIITGCGAVATAVKWAVGRITKSSDRNADVMKQALDRNSDVLVDNTRSNAVLTTKIDAIADFVQDGAKKRRTPAKGTAVHRPSTHGDDK